MNIVDYSDFFGYVDEFTKPDGSSSIINLTSNIFEEVNNSYKKSLDCYKEKDQNEARRRLEILKFVESRLEGGWTPDNLVPLLEEYKESKEKAIPSWRILVNWKTAYFKSGRNIHSLVPKHAEKGRKRQNINSQHIFNEALKEVYLKAERNSIAQTYEHYKSRVNEENRKREIDKLVLISKTSFYERVKDLPPYDVCVARYGKRFADKKYRKVRSIMPATKPMEYVEIDHTPAPVILLDDKLDIPLGRPYLTILYDRFSACIVGLYVSFREPGYESVRYAFINAVLKKNWVKEKYPMIDNDWPCHGKISYLVVDNAAEFWSKSLESALKPLVTDIVYTPAAKPWKKPHVESSFNTFYKLLFSKLPGKTFNNISELHDYNPKVDAVVNVSTFLELLHKWLIDYYHKKLDSRETRIPYHKWNESNWLPNYYDNQEAEQLKIETGILNHRVLSAEGSPHKSPRA